MKPIIEGKRRKIVYPAGILVVRAGHKYSKKGDTAFERTDSKQAVSPVRSMKKYPPYWNRMGTLKSRLNA